MAITGHVHLTIIQILRPPQNFCSDEGSQACAFEPRSLNITQLWREQRDPGRCGWYSLELYSKQSTQLCVVTLRLAPTVPFARPLFIYASFSLVGSETGKF